MSPPPPKGSSRRTAAAATRPATPIMGFDPDVTPGALDAFHAWLTKSGVKLGDNAVLSGRSPLDGRRGLIATKPIENGQSVLAVPLTLGLTAAGLQRSGIAQYVTGFEGWTGDTGVIALQILWERAQGEGSKMAPWIAVLPALGELEMPLFWDEADLKLADASSTRVSVFERRLPFPICYLLPPWKHLFPSDIVSCRGGTAVVFVGSIMTYFYIHTYLCAFSKCSIHGA